MAPTDKQWQAPRVGVITLIILAELAAAVGLRTLALRVGWL